MFIFKVYNCIVQKTAEEFIISLAGKNTVKGEKIWI